MSKKKKVLLGVGFIVFLIVLWFGVYFAWLQVKPKGDNVLTAEELKKYDDESKESVFKEATITIDNKDYALSDVKKDMISDDVVVNVKVNNREVQGYVTVSDVIKEAEVRLSDSDSYAQVIIPDEEK